MQPLVEPFKAARLVVQAVGEAAKVASDIGDLFGCSQQPSVQRHQALRRRRSPNAVPGLRRAACRRHRSQRCPHHPGWRCGPQRWRC